MHTTDSERAKYVETWKNDDYRICSPGLRHLKGALQWMQPERGASITDWGSGSGMASDSMVRQGFKVRMVDIAANAYRGNNGPVIEACLWELPDDLGPTQYGFCADVMEHLPPEKVDAVFQQIAARTERSCYFQIALFADMWHGRNLHLSVFPAEWWQERILAAFPRAEFQLGHRNRHLLAVAHA